MKEEVYTAPSNFKRGKLIVGSYKVSDLIIIGVGVFIAIGGILLGCCVIQVIDFGIYSVQKNFKGSILCVAALISTAGATGALFYNIIH